MFYHDYGYRKNLGIVPLIYICSLKT